MLAKTYYIENAARLSTSLDQLVIEQVNQGGEKIQITRPLADAGFILLDHPQIQLSLPLLQRCIENNVILTICDQKHLPAGLLIPMEGHSLSGGRMRTQLEASKPLKKKLWQITIEAKIKNQALVLKHFNLPYKILTEYSRKVRSGDSSNLESSAAVYYWNRLFKHLKEFRRDRFGPNPNSALNFIYAILRAQVAKSLVAAGLFPFMGIHHKNMYNSFCLADDIMEPFRPYADQMIRDMLDQEIVSVEDNDLSKEIRTLCLSILNRDVVWNGSKKPLQLAVMSVCSGLAQSFETGNSEDLIYPEYE